MDQLKKKKHISIIIIIGGHIIGKRCSGAFLCNERSQKKSFGRLSPYVKQSYTVICYINPHKREHLASFSLFYNVGCKFPRR